jgi:hypothetical protein
MAPITKLFKIAKVFEVLAMVYALQKFKHCLLSNKFTFYVDHMTLVYLVNKPQVYGKLTRWL